MYTATKAVHKIMGMKKRIRVIQGGTSAGKTIATLLILINRAQVKFETPELTSVVQETIPALKRGALRDFKKIMKTHNYWKDSEWNSTDSIYTFSTGNQIEFFSADNGDKLRGARRDWLFMNEANNMEFEAFEQLEVRTLKGIYLDYNPTNEFWALTELVGKRNDVDFLILTYLDNDSLDQRIVDSIEQRKNRKGWWQVYGLGQLGEVEGKIYKEWIILDEMPKEARFLRYGLDFGYTNDPSSLVAIYRYNGGFLIDEVFYKKGMPNREIAESIKSHGENGLVLADSAEPKSIDEIGTYGINIIGAWKGAGSVLAGIQFIQDQKIFLTKRSANVLHEYRNYLWETDRDGKILNEPEHTYSHSMDAVRYAIAYDVKSDSILEDDTPASTGILPFYPDMGV
jgi:phage terminase large subunit